MNNHFDKVWPNKQIAQHKTAASLLCRIIDEAFNFIRQNADVSEYDVQQFIVQKYSDYNLVPDADPPIVAFRESTANIHYFPEQDVSRKLENDSLIMIDIWARLDEADAPYADITWMAWHGGEVPAEIQKGFNAVVKSRDAGLAYIRRCLSEGSEVENRELSDVMTDITLSSGLQNVIPHCFGHSLGFDSPHGKTEPIYDQSKTAMLRDVGYAIEPGIYVDGKYGFRTEIDVIVYGHGNFEETTKVQMELEIV